MPYVLTLLIAGCRLAGFKSPAFQAIAHLYVGMLFFGWVAARHPVKEANGRRAGWLAFGLIAVEVAAFALERLGPCLF